MNNQVNVQVGNLASSKVNSEDLGEEEDKEESGICVTVTPLEFRSSLSSEDENETSSQVFSELSSLRDIIKAKNASKFVAATK